MSTEEQVAACQAKSKKRLAIARKDGNNPNVQAKIMSQYQDCLTVALSRSLQQKEDEVRFQDEIRLQIAQGMENFTCIDTTLESTPDVDERQWTSDKDEVTRTVHVKLDRPASRIHVVDNFAYPEECDAMEETAKSKLQHASVADGKGGAHMSEHRKAMQAGISPKWDKEQDGDLVTRLSRRVYDYTNQVLGLNITEHGQEPLMSIQYEGRGYDDTTPDRYTPHCDGNCVGEPHLYGSRMATMVIYWYVLLGVYFYCTD